MLHTLSDGDWPQSGAGVSPLDGAEEHLEYLLLAELIPNLAWMASADGSIYWYNRRWYEYTGTTFEQMKGWGWQSVHHPDSLDGVVRRWRSSIESGEPFEMTFPLRRADGVFRPFLTRVVPLKQADGTVLRWFGTNTDVAPEHEAAEALRQSEQRFRTATEAVSGVLWTNDPNGEMQGEQPGWSQFTGQSIEQYRGYGWSTVVHPDDAKPTIEAWQQAVRESRLFSFEHRVRRHDGQYRLCSIRALPIRNGEGAVLEWVGVHTDITEDRERQEELHATVTALRRQEELVGVAEITNNVGFWRWEPSTRSLFLTSGTRHLLGLALTGPIPLEQVFACLHPEDAPRISAAVRAALISHHLQEEFRVAGSSAASPRWLVSVAHSVQPHGGSPYLVGMLLDITRQKRSADALIRAEKLAIAGRLAASIAHEINNPLEAITNLMYLLLHSNLSEEQRGYCTTMMGELARVSEITTHTLRFHRQSTRPAEAQCGALIDSVLALFEGRMRNAGVTVARRLAGQNSIFGYEGELRQVLANLVGNAVDAMSNATGPRTLFVRSRPGRQWNTGQMGMLITVADTGGGISPDILDQIFEPFFTTKGETGTGLGLWISTELVEKHGGALTVRSSQAPGKHGTVFRLFLPGATALPLQLLRA